MRSTIRVIAVVLLSAALGGWAATVSGVVRTPATTAGGTGTPIEGAKVVLTKVALGGILGGGAQTRLDSVMTNAQGQFSFAKVDTGIALLAATKTGYQSGSGYVAVAKDTGAYTVNITMRPPPDTTPGKLEGTVRRGSEQGTPVAGATVVVTRSGGGTAFRDTLTTDAQGHFAINSLAAATYTLRASATGYQAAGVTAMVRAHDSTVADIALLPLNATGSVSGKVVKASDGSAIAGAVIILSSRGGLGGTSRADTVKSAADGSYKIDSVPAEQTFNLSVTATGYQSASSTGLVVTLDEKRVIDFTLVPTVAGDSTHGSVAGKVTDNAGKALAGARVILARSTIGATAADTVTTNAQGDFVFPSVTAGASYRITVSLTGYRVASAMVIVAVGQTSLADFVLQATTAVGTVAVSQAEMRLYAGPPGRLVLESPAAGSAGRVRIYDVRGAIGFAGALPAGTTRMDIPWAGGRTGYGVVERGGEIHRLAITPAR